MGLKCLHQSLPKQSFACEMPISLSRVNLNHIQAYTERYMVTPKFDGLRVTVVMHEWRVYICSSNRIEVAASLFAKRPTSVWEGEALWCDDIMEIHLFDVRVHEGKLCRSETWEERQALLPDLDSNTWCQLLPIQWFKKRHWSYSRDILNNIQTRSTSFRRPWMTNLDSSPSSASSSPDPNQAAAPATELILNQLRTPTTLSRALKKICKRETNQNAVGDRPSVPPTPENRHTGVGIQHDHAGWLWWQHDKWYNIDGLIIIAKKHVHGSGLFKWKPMRCATIDFELRGVLCSTSDRQICRTRGISPTVYELAPPSWAEVVDFYGRRGLREYVKVPDEFRTLFQGSPLIAECRYDPKQGHYTMIRHRPDKQRGNSILTHVNSLYDQLDNIQITDLFIEPSSGDERKN
jgi:hypothetical protein